MDRNEGLQKLSFRTQGCVYGTLLCGLSVVVHPAIPEKRPEKYQGETGKMMVRIGGILITAAMAALLVT